MTAGTVLQVLRQRGFVQDVTDEQGLADLLARERVTFYYGMDPTAPSLHVGNLIGLMAMGWLQRAGHRPIALAGGGTGRIGDPSGRDDERQLLGEEELQANLAGIRTQASRFVDLSSDAAGLVVDNHDWLSQLRFLDVLRDVGKHFSVNAMIARESVRRRLESREQGISFTEFSYQVLQAYDFAHLYRSEGCRLQIGGSDQWGNITAGTDLVRRMLGGHAFGLAWPLLTTATGEKFGKSAGNAVWLDPGLTSPYAYYQYWINTDDADVGRFLRLFTFLDAEEIAELERAQAADPASRVAQRRLAEEATRTVHGDQAVAEARRATEILFGDQPLRGLSDRVLADAFAAAPSVELPRDALAQRLGVPELLVSAGAARSNSEARRLLSQGGVRVNGVRVTDADATVGPEDLASDTTMVLRVGKKRHHLVRFR